MRHWVTQITVKLPYVSATDDLHCYLVHFAETMAGAKIAEDKRMIRLRDLVTGDVLKSFQDLTPEDRLSFTTAKDRLLKAHNFTAEGYRELFIQAKPISNKSSLTRLLHNNLLAINICLVCLHLCKLPFCTCLPSFTSFPNCYPKQNVSCQ